MHNITVIASNVCSNLALRMSNIITSPSTTWITSDCFSFVVINQTWVGINDDRQQQSLPATRENGDAVTVYGVVESRWILTRMVGHCSWLRFMIGTWMIATATGSILILPWIVVECANPNIIVNSFPVSLVPCCAACCRTKYHNAWQTYPKTASISDTCTTQTTEVLECGTNQETLVQNTMCRE